MTYRVGACRADVQARGGRTLEGMAERGGGGREGGWTKRVWSEKLIGSNTTSERGGCRFVPIGMGEGGVRDGRERDICLKLFGSKGRFHCPIG